MIFRMLVIFGLLLSGSLHAENVVLGAGKDFEARLHSHLTTINAGDVLILPEGHFTLTRGLSLVQQGVELRGQGPDKTILDFSDQQEGAQGLLVRANNIGLTGFAIKNASGDGLVVRGAKRIKVDHVNVIWDRMAGSDGRGYGIYPVLSKQVVVSNCYVSGAKEAGIYVGQSIDAVIQGNRVENNTSGIDVENSSGVVVKGNVATGNSLGIVVSKRPNLLRKSSYNIRLLNNTISENNMRNEAPSHSLISLLGEGIGVIVVASENVTLKENGFSGQEASHVVVIDYASTGRSADSDPLFSRANLSINLVNNNFSRRSLPVDVDVANEDWRGMAGLDVLWDGVTQNIKGETQNSLCIENESPIYFKNQSTMDGSAHRYLEVTDSAQCNPN